MGEEWITWGGGECPVALGTRVVVKFRSGEIPAQSLALDWVWAWGCAGRNNDIVAYHVIQKEELPQPKSEWIEWPGGECPVGEDTKIDIAFRDGDVYSGENAGDWSWSLNNLGGDILKYRIAQKEEAPQPKNEWLTWKGGDCPVPPETRVEITYPDGSIASPLAKDIRWFWLHKGHGGDIVKYRIFQKEEPNPAIRNFDTGATRSPDTNRYDVEGFISPIVTERYCQYMQKHQKQSDGSLRASDNWQKGMPLETYIKGMSRHKLHLDIRHRGFEVQDKMAAENTEEDLCAILFNVQGYLFELLKDKRRKV